MTSEDLKIQLESLGIKADSLTDEVKLKLRAWLADQKVQLDTKTRRKVRAFWEGVACVALVVGYAAGLYVARLMG